MERDYNFSIGQKVKIWDDVDLRMCYGVIEDKTANTVFVKWRDLDETIEYERGEHTWYQIKKSKK